MPSVAALLTEGIALHQQGKLQAASALYRQVLAITPQQFDALHLLGVIARQSGNAALAIELISDALAIDQLNPQAHCNLGAALQDAGRPDAALASYDQALRLRPAYDIAHCNRGNTLRKLGRLDEALSSYQRALAIRPAYPEACCNHALVLHDLGRPEHALAGAERALALRPDYPEALRARAAALHSLGRYADAVDSYDRAIALRSADAELFCCRASALHKLHRFDDALRDYEQAIALRRDYTAAHHYRANTLAAMKRSEQAIAGYRRALELGADAAQIRFALAALGAEPAPSEAPPGYVKALFDQYAGHFDQHLVDTLAYQTPGLIAAALDRSAMANLGDTLDLGCGTGLCAPLLRPLSRSLSGVDLSENMLAKARERGLYDALESADIRQFLAPRHAEFDLVVAADVFVYVGELGPTFHLIHQAMRGGALFCFSVEQGPGAGYTLAPSNRYTHSLDYVQRQGAICGFEWVDAGLHALRSDRQAPVMGYVVLLRKPARA